MATVAELGAGFADKVLCAQSTFRLVMDAMARPGTIQHLAATAGAPAPVMRGTAAIALTLFDHDTPVWLDRKMSATRDVGKWLRFHTGAPVVADPSSCSFALIDEGGALPALDRFAFGTNEYPDRSTTLVVQVETLTRGPAVELSGPGIDGMTILRAAVEPADLFERLAINKVLFPRGVDVVLVADDAVVAIPRTTRCTVHGG
jgi:alpha-D-ribose 1-methylphosphonate 5-triphosphate synthase subunit PhnH